MNLIKVISTSVNTLNQRVIKMFRFSRLDVQTALEVSPYGFDSNPVAGMVAVYAPTTDKGETMIIGYINKNQKAGVGELRLFSTNASGDEKFYTWLKSDGTYEMGGKVDNAVRYAKLNLALQNEVAKINAELGKINGAIVALGGTYAVSPITLDISAAKINEIKTL